ncbi:hypothetical protein PSTT_16099, partial [Puccinia striiformis]
TQSITKKKEADFKLNQILDGCQEAELKQKDLIQIQADLEHQRSFISKCSSVVIRDLADAEPAIKEAQAAVRNIEKRHLKELGTMGSPHEGVKLVMQSVCTILGRGTEDWKAMQGILRNNNFITSIMNFDTAKKVDHALCEKMNNNSLNLPSFNFDSIIQASNAGGPLCKWVIAQVKFSET